MKLDPKHLFAIASINRTGGLTGAARELNTSQPALSRLVADLEARLGAPLFDKRVRPWRLTALGVSLAQQGQVIQIAQERAGRAVEQFLVGDDGVIRVGGTPFFVDAIVSGMVAEFQKSYGNIRVDQSYGYPDQLIKLLLGGEIDVAICPIDVLDEELDLDFTPLLAARNVVACRADHPLVGKPNLKPDALLNYPWIAPPPGSPLNLDLRSSLARLELERVRIAYSGGTLASVVNHLRISDCMAVLPHSVVFAMRQRGGISALPIELEAPTRTLGLLTTGGSNQPRSIVNFADHLIASFDLIRDQIRRHEEIIVWGR